MKKLYPILLLLLLSFLLMNIKSFSQTEEGTLLVVSFQKIKMSDIEASNKLINEKFAPILNALVDEKLLLSWGLFNHSWGDEWNVNMWYTVKDLNAFNKFWEEYIKRINETQSAAWKELRGYIQEHKDNIYNVVNQYPIPKNNK